LGESEGSLLGIRAHSSLGTALFRYATAARHWASIEGREKAGPHMWSSRTILEGPWSIEASSWRKINWDESCSGYFYLQGQARLELEVRSGRSNLI
jgi:hypothetical protein